MAGSASGRRCPICSKPTVDAYRPFCSKRCADVDLHRWLGGHYAVPVIEEDGGNRDGEPGESDLRSRLNVIDGGEDK